MKPSFKSWSIVLPVSVALHFAVLVGLKPQSVGVQEPPAGAEISVAASLAGIMGQASEMTEEVTTEQDEAIEPTEQTTPSPDQMAAIEPQTVENVSKKPLQESPVRPTDTIPTTETKPVDTKPTEAKPVADETEAVSTAVSEAQSVTEVPIAALQSTTPTPMQELEAANRVEPRSVAVPSVSEPKPESAQPVNAKPKPAKVKRKKTRKRAARTPPGNNRRGTAGQQRGAKKGTSRASSGAIFSYAARVRARIVGNRPGAAGTGRVVVSFGLSTSGGLRFARIARSSGNSSVDRAALSAVRRSSPFPRPPKGASSGQLRFSIPFHFQ